MSTTVLAPKEWRPNNWENVKDRILQDAGILGSPTANKLIEETASTILEAYDREQFAEHAKTYCSEMGWRPPA